VNYAIKRKMSVAAQNLCFSLGISPRIASRARVARVLMFHGIGDKDHSSQLLEDKIVFLKKHFKIVPLEHLLKKLNAGESLHNEVVLTFDDGLKNNAIHAYPILKKFNAPATFYVCPGLIESGSWLWNHEARERLRTLPDLKLKELALQWGCNCELENIVDCLKGLNLIERVKAEETIRSCTTSFTPSAEQRNSYDIMSWRDLKNLDKDLITVGSHTANHVIAKDLTNDELHLEIVGSRKTLEQELDRPIEHFCYPNGDFDSATVNMVKKTYQSAVTTGEGVVKLNDDQHLLSRVISESDIEYFAWRLIRPTS